MTTVNCSALSAGGAVSAKGIWSRVITDDLQPSLEPRPDRASAAKPDLEAQGRTIRVDARGRHCPIPTLRLGRALRKAEAGVIVELIADDPMARIDAPHFAIQAGHEVVAISESAGVISVRVKKIDITN